MKLCVCSPAFRLLRKSEMRPIWSLSPGLCRMARAQTCWIRLTRSYPLMLLTHSVMSGLSDKQLAKKIKAIESDIPVIILTGFGEYLHLRGIPPDNIDRILSNHVPVK